MSAIAARLGGRPRVFSLRRIRGQVFAAAAVAVTSVAIIISTGGGAPPPPPAGTAQLWIDTNGGSCTRHGTAAAWVDSEGCSSMQAALAACTAGDTIRMVAGSSYGGQTITAVKSSPGCAIIGDTTGGGVTVSGITPEGAWFSIANVTATGSLGFEDVGSGLPHDFTLTNVSAATGFWDGGSNIVWNGGQIGPANVDTGNYRPAVGLQIQGIPNAMSNVLIKGVTFKDLTTTSTCTNGGGGCHTETVRIDGGTSNITFDGNIFVGGGYSSARFLIGLVTGSAPANLVWQNNYFGRPSQSGAFYQDIVVDSGGGGAAGCGSAQFLYNTYPSDSGQPFGSPSCTSTITWTGNLGRKPACSGTFTKNAWIGGTCGGTDTNVANNNTAADGYTLLGSNGLGQSSGYPTNDINGGTRSGTTDAGADQFGAP